MRGHRAAAADVIAAVAFVLVGAWGVVNLSESDWYIGGLMVASAVVGLWSLAVRMRQARRHRPQGPLPPANKAAG